MHDLPTNAKPRRRRIGHARPKPAPGGRAERRTAAAAPSSAGAARWCVYLLICGDGSLYAGATNDLGRRIERHVAGRGARYTRGRGPLALAFCEPAIDRGSALRRERELKRLPREEKLALCGQLR